MRHFCIDYGTNKSSIEVSELDRAIGPWRNPTNLANNPTNVQEAQAKVPSLSFLSFLFNISRKIKPSTNSNSAAQGEIKTVPRR